MRVPRLDYTPLSALLARLESITPTTLYLRAMWLSVPNLLLLITVVILDIFHPDYWFQAGLILVAFAGIWLQDRLVRRSLTKMRAEALREWDEIDRRMRAIGAYRDPPADTRS